MHTNHALATTVLLTALIIAAGLLHPSDSTTRELVELSATRNNETQDDAAGAPALTTENGGRTLRDGHDPAAADYPIRAKLPRAVVYAQTQAELERSITALARFETAGLDLPLELEIWFHHHAGSGRGCNGHRGTQGKRNKVFFVNICSPVEFTLLHELAHAWAAQNVSTTEQQEFVEMRSGAHSWADTDEEWAHRGSEHLADIMAWGLLDEPVRPTRMLPNDDESLRAAFTFLTGIEPLHHVAPATVALSPESAGAPVDRTVPVASSAYDRANEAQ